VVSYAVGQEEVKDLLEWGLPAEVYLLSVLWNRSIFEYDAIFDKDLFDFELVDNLASLVY
jgi:hypothetical protein